MNDGQSSKMCKNEEVDVNVEKNMNTEVSYIIFKLCKKLILWEA